LTKPVAVNTGLALPRSLWWQNFRLSGIFVAYVRKKTNETFCCLSE